MLKARLLDVPPIHHSSEQMDADPHYLPVSASVTRIHYNRDLFLTLLASANTNARVERDHPVDGRGATPMQLITLDNIQRRTAVGLLAVQHNALRDTATSYVNQDDSFLWSRLVNTFRILFIICEPRFFF